MIAEIKPVCDRQNGARDTGEKLGLFLGIKGTWYEYGEKIAKENKLNLLQSN